MTEIVCVRVRVRVCMHACVRVCQSRCVPDSTLLPQSRREALLLWSTQSSYLTLLYVLLLCIQLLYIFFTRGPAVAVVYEWGKYL